MRWCEQVGLLTWLLAIVTIELILPHHSVWKVQPSSSIYSPLPQQKALLAASRALAAPPISAPSKSNALGAL